MTNAQMRQQAKTYENSMPPNTTHSNERIYMTKNVFDVVLFLLFYEVMKLSLPFDLHIWVRNRDPIYNYDSLKNENNPPPYYACVHRF